MNYDHYRKIRDEETRREYFRDYRRAERESKKEPKKTNGKVKKAKLNGEEKLLGGAPQRPRHRLAPHGEDAR